MNEDLQKLEAFLLETESQTREEALEELASHGVDVHRLEERVSAIVRQGYAAALKKLAAEQQQETVSRPSWFSDLPRMSREAMLALFERINGGEFGEECRSLAMQRCRNRSTSDLTDEEIRSWLEDVGDLLGESQE